MKRLLPLLALLLFSFNIPLQEKATLEVRFLHGENRCEYCEKIERAVKKTIYLHFPEQAKDKRIVFVSINLDSEENKSLANKYEIWGSALILKSTQGGREKNTDISELVHQHAHNEKELIRLLKLEFEKLLK